MLNDNQLKHLLCLVNVSVVPEPQRTSVRHHLHLYSGNRFQPLTFCVLRGSLLIFAIKRSVFFRNISWICPCSTEEKLKNPNLQILNDIYNKTKLKNWDENELEQPLVSGSSGKKEPHRKLAPDKDLQVKSSPVKRHSVSRPAWLLNSCCPCRSFNNPSDCFHKLYTLNISDTHTHTHSWFTEFGEGRGDSDHVITQAQEGGRSRVGGALEVEAGECWHSVVVALLSECVRVCGLQRGEGQSRWTLWSVTQSQLKENCLRCFTSGFVIHATL